MICTPLRIHPGISSSFGVPVPILRAFGATNISKNYPFRALARSGSTDLQKEIVTYLQHHPHIQQNSSSTMAFLLPGLRRSLLLSTPLILSTPLLVHSLKRPILCDSADPFRKVTSDLRQNYAHEAQTPVITTSGAPNPRAIRQISMGSIFGVLAGLGVSVFSKPLAVLIGLGIVLVQVRM